MAKKNKKNLIILTAGGTGGHIFPAESLAEELLKRGYLVEFITDRRGKENGKGKLHQIPNYAVSAGALVGKSKLFKIKSLFKTGIGTLQAIWILLKRKPVCIVGFGGYASFPCCMAAIVLRKPLIIHEQNSIMSRTNRILSRFAVLIAKTFKNTLYIPKNTKTVLTGMPIRKNIIDIRNTPYPSLKKTDTFQILVLGGSQGAKIFAEVVPEALKGFDKETQKRIKIIQQCREDDILPVKNSYKGFNGKVVLSHFFTNMPELYSSSHIIISRAGASSVCEILAVGIPSILVPLPIAADDHQSFNAKEISSAEAGYVLNQKDFTSAKLLYILNDLINDSGKLKTMAANAKKHGITDSAKRFADAVELDIIKG